MVLVAVLLPARAQTISKLLKRANQPCSFVSSFAHCRTLVLCRNRGATEADVETRAGHQMDSHFVLLRLGMIGLSVPQLTSSSVWVCHCQGKR